jgi:phosphonate transport system substrate-binding protein
MQTNRETAMPFKFSPIILLPLLLLGAITVLIYSTFMDISTPAPDAAFSPRTPDTGLGQDTVHVGVISRFSPNLIYEGYQPIMEFLSRESGRTFALMLSSSYDETIAQLDQDKIQAAFLGTFLYLKARRDHPIRCILKPLNSQSEPFFHSVVVTRTDSKVRSVADLRGKRLALPSRLSFSGNWLLRYELARHRLQPADLDSIHYFGFHHTVVYQVLLGQFDAGAVKDRVAEEFAGKGIRIIAASEDIPGSPIIVRKDLDPRIIQAMTTAMLKIDTSQPQYLALVKDWDPEFAHGFAPAEDSDYDQVAGIFGSLEE